MTAYSARDGTGLRAGDHPSRPAAAPDSRHVVDVADPRRGLAGQRRGCRRTAGRAGLRVADLCGTGLDLPGPRLGDHRGPTRSRSAPRVGGVPGSLWAMRCPSWEPSGLIAVGDRREASPAPRRQPALRRLDGVQQPGEVCRGRPRGPGSPWARPQLVVWATTIGSVAWPQPRRPERAGVPDARASLDSLDPSSSRSSG